MGLSPSPTSKSSPKTACAITKPIGYCVAIVLSSSLSLGLSSAPKMWTSGVGSICPLRAIVRRSKRTPCLFKLSQVLASLAIHRNNTLLLWTSVLTLMLPCDFVCALSIADRNKHIPRVRSLIPHLACFIALC